MDSELKRLVELERQRRQREGLPPGSRSAQPELTEEWRLRVTQAAEHVSLFDLDLRITFMNRVQLTLAGVEAGVSARGQNLVGLPILTCIDPSKHAAFLQATAAAYVSGLPHYYETDGAGLGGIPTAYRNWVTPLPGSDGPSGFASVSVDITHLGRAQRDIRLAEEGQRALEAQLAQAQKMQALGQLTGGIAHDFNNLLTVIVGSLALLKREGEGSARALDLTRQAESAAERAAALTQRLLAFSRRQPLRPQSVDPQMLLQGMEQLLRRTLPANVTLSVKVQDSTWLCRADPVQLESAVLNLAINARDAMPKGGSLQITARNERIEHSSFGAPALAASDLERDGLSDGDYVLIEVTDSGTGMTTEVLSQAFEPFFTTKGVGRGSGLGLSMVYGFAKQSGGLATIRSQVGAGTSVKLHLPRSRKKVSSVTLPAVQVSTPGAGQLVLVVEDDAVVRQLVCDMLQKLRYRTLAAEDGRRAQQLLASRSDIALLLTDMGLPTGMSGVELVSALRAGGSRLPVLFMTAYNHDTGSSEAIEDVRLLLKPFSEAVLSAAVTEALRETDAVAAPS